MKILNLRDTHFRGKNSIHRIGNLYEDTLLKVDEVISLSKDCDIVLHDGDFFDSAHVSNTVIDDIIDRIEESKKHWYVTVGNHDLIGQNWEVSKGGALAHVFRRSKYIHQLTELEFEDCYIKSFPYYYTCEEDIKTKGLKHNKKDKFTIASTHAFISIKPFMKQVLHVQAKDIDTNFDLVTCSHFHSLFNHEIGKTRFINSGALVRLSVTEREHKPSIAIIDTKKRSAEIIELKSAKNAENIFDLSKIDEKKEFNANIDDFIKSIESAHFQETSITGMVSQIAKEQKIDKKVVDLILNKIGEINEN